MFKIEFMQKQRYLQRNLVENTINIILGYWQQYKAFFLKKQLMIRIVGKVMKLIHKDGVQKLLLSSLIINFLELDPGYSYEC